LGLGGVSRGGEMDELPFFSSFCGSGSDCLL
jgi:hypothetical protein